jgi:hypothetical protein
MVVKRNIKFLVPQQMKESIQLFNEDLKAIQRVENKPPLDIKKFKSPFKPTDYRTINQIEQENQFMKEARALSKHSRELYEENK